MTERTVTIGAGPKRVLQLLKQIGPSSADSLADQLTVSATAIRQHLYVLNKKGLAVSKGQLRPMGRPVKIWELTEEATAHFPQVGSQMVESLLRSTQEVLGSEGMKTAMCGCVDEQVTRYSKEIQGGETLFERLKALVAVRDADGYFAQLECQEDETFIIYENHCPISGAVASCPDLCNAELIIFQNLFKDEAVVKRLEHMKKGDRRCSYHIKKKYKQP